MECLSLQTFWKKHYYIWTSLVSSGAIVLGNLKFLHRCNGTSKPHKQTIHCSTVRFKHETFYIGRTITEFLDAQHIDIGIIFSHLPL